MDRCLTPEEIRVVREHGFDEHGLRFSIEELQSVIPEDLSMEALSRYVDAITFAKVESQDCDFFRSQLTDIPRNIRISVTGLGNLAYVALNMRDKDIRVRASRLFHKIISNAPDP